MPEYISREAVLKHLNECKEDPFFGTDMARICSAISIFIEEMQAADIQEKKYCKMIPLEPDCRGYTDVFICTNCHHHIHLGFIRKEYSGSYCLECGAKVKDGDTDNNVRNLTDEETEIYDSWLNSEARDTGVNIMDGDING